MNKILAVEPASHLSGTENSLIEGCISSIDQCLGVIHTATADIYQTSLQGNSSIGSHIRHIIDRFNCFIDGVAIGTVDYDQRNRDPSLELNRKAASDALAAIKEKLVTDTSLFSNDLSVIESVDAGCDSVKVSSSIERELMGLVSHTIHHLAIIAMLLRTQGCDVGDVVGKAPSTLKFENSQR